MTNRLLFFAILLLRLFNVFLVQSSFVPDEYWQSIEVSHKLTFGYGYTTWEFDKKIRSCFYPFIIHLLYRVVPDSRLFIIHAPRVLQAILSAVGDFCAYKLAAKYFDKSCGMWTAFNILTSWFLFYCSPRTLTNMAEASLTSCGFYFYPWSSTSKCRLSSKYLWFAAASTVIRPTAIVTWLPLYLWHILRGKHKVSLLKHTFFVGLAALSAMLLIDRWCYGEWVFTLYNFFLFNWSNDIGAFYGSHNFVWYFTAGLPSVLGLQIVPFLCGLALPQLKPFYLLILWFIIIFSMPSHKEFRFLLPILHLCMIICGVVMNEIGSGRLKIWGIKINQKVNTFLAPLLLLSSVSLVIYMGLFHQRGVIDATLHLSETMNDNSSVLFLMPCHSTPYYGYIHKDISMRFLTCEPNFENDLTYVEEADEFFAGPHEWLSRNYESNSSFPLPTHIVLFDTVYRENSYIPRFLSRHQYHRCFSTFHSNFPQVRTGGYVYIYCK